MPVSSQKRLLDDGPRIEPGTLCWRAVILSVVLSMSMTLHSQEVRDQSSVEAIGNHYELAQKAQESGDVIRANSEYKMFISEAFRRLSVRYAAGGDLRRSLDLLQQALALAPNDSALRLDYIRERRVSGDYSEAKAAAESLLVLEPDNSDAHLELGRI